MFVHPPRLGLATLRRYCVHSTLVPAIVPILFSPHDWEIHVVELLLSDGRVCAEKRESEVDDWRKFSIHWCVRFPPPQISRTNPSQNHLFVPFVSVCLFLGSQFVLCCEGTAVQDLAS
jgi:hypothetical protein